jgi:hypothetical protein
MNRLKLVLLVTALAFHVSSTEALEWVVYDGTIPDNAVMLNDGTEDAVVCRHGAKVGLVTDGGKCHSVKLGSKDVKKKTQDDGYEILVDNSETEIEEAVAEATDGLYTQAEYVAAVASASLEGCSAVWTWGPIRVESKYPVAEVEQVMACHSCINGILKLDY